MKIDKRILIIGTIPFDPQESSRAFDSYFHFYDSNCLHQIFSNPKEPIKGHCSSLFQITDSMVLDKWLHPKRKIGRIYYKHLLNEQREYETGFDDRSYLYKKGKKHTPLIRILRGILWKRNKWCSKELLNWVENFKPDCIFLAFSDDYFINKIALFFSKKYNIPIVSCIGDDYYFNSKFSVNPFYWIYRITYKRLIRKVINRTKQAIYISDKIKNKYNTYFGIRGETVYLTSNVARTNYKTINNKSPLITYFGNIRMGRNESLIEIANALRKYNSNFKISVYSTEVDETYYSKLKAHPNINYCGSVSYDIVKTTMEKSDLNIIVEGFRKKDINLSRYSLSTKAADCIASGVLTLVYGSRECGIVEYMMDNDVSVVCTEKNMIFDTIRDIFEGKVDTKTLYENGIRVFEKNHTLKQSNKISLDVFNSAIEEMI